MREAAGHVPAVGADAVVGTLPELRELGVRMALDGVGTEYSGLATLREVVVEGIKLDRALLRSLATDDRSMAIADAVGGMSHRLGMVTTDEGVESPDEAGHAGAAGCGIGQVCDFAPPLPSAGIGELLG